MKRKILVCGATGFIGRNMAEYLAEQDDCEVYGTYHGSQPLDHPKIKMIQADLTSSETVSAVVKGMDVVIQAAATTSGAKDTINKPYYHVTDNAVMNSLIFRGAFENKVKQVIFFSCTTMYPNSDVPVKETDFDANKGVYPKYFGVGWTKVYLEKMSEFFSGLGETKFTVIRHTNIYGPYDKYDLERSHVFGATMTKVMTAKDNGKVVVWGTGEESRDLLYISDLVDFVNLAIRKQENKFELVNVGLQEAITIKDLVAKIIACSGKKLTVEHDTSKPTIKTGLCVDTSKAKEIFGWSAKVSLDDGIKKTMEWYRANIKLEEVSV